MELKDLGFDDWFREQHEERSPSECSLARVTAVDRDRYLVRNNEIEVPAQLAGRLMYSIDSSVDLPCVGDWTYVRYHSADTLAIIHDLLPRKTVLRRKTAGKNVGHQLIAANIDVALIIQSCDSDFNLRRLERYLVIVNQDHIESAVLLSKSDLTGPHDLNEKISEIGNAGIAASVIAFSNKTHSGLDTIRQLLANGKTYCLLGSSGVGKTTLLNHLMGREAFDTHPVRQKDGKGRHTTARRQLIVLDSGAMLIDNPGMRELGLLGVGTGLDESFADMHELSSGCHFRDCSHSSEMGCAILAAVECGEVSEDRYRSYLKLMRESEYHQMSYIEKRKKDRKFGQLIKSVMKHKKRNK